MSVDKLEQLSSFMDGELEQPAGSLLDAVKGDTALQGAWQRYHLIGDCLRGHLPDRINLELSRNIHTAVASEPAILSPQRPRTFRLQNVLKPAAGLAIAASVAVVAVIGFQSLSPTDIGSQQHMTGPSLAVSTTPEPAVQYAADRPPARVVSTEARQAMPVQRQQMDPQYRFNSYLLNHSEYRANTGVQAFTPYVRIVTHDREE